MKCPFCYGEMEEGVIQSGQIVLWAKKKHIISLNPKEGEVELSRNLMGYCSIPAWICKSCKKVVADYSKTECCGE